MPWGIPTSAFTSGMSSLVGELRLKLKDTGTVVTDYLVGDGVTPIFQLTSSSIKPSSEYIYVDNTDVTVAGTAVIDYSSGLLQFAAAPVEDTAIRVTYLNYEKTDDELQTYIVDSIIRTNNLLSSSNISKSDPVMTDLEHELVILLSVRDSYIYDALYAASTSISWREGRDSIDKTSIPQGYKNSIGLIETKLMAMLKEVQFARTGTMRSGGQGPGTILSYSAIDWITVNA